MVRAPHAGRDFKENNMSAVSTGNTAVSSADTAARLYPGGNGNQSQGGGSQDNSNNGSPVASPYVVTNMTEGKTIYVDPNTGKSFEMETRNDTDKRKSKEGADNPYNGRITGVFYPETDEDKKKFGWGAITTDDTRGRWIHGGGNNTTLAPDPSAPRQGWVPTLGCTRGQNEDVHQMAKEIEQFQKNNPNVPINYYRVRPEK